MAWDFSTDPEFEQQLEWMRTFVREEIWPIEPIVEEFRVGTLTLGWDAGSTASRPRSLRFRSRSRSAASGRRTSTPSSAARASGR